MPFLMIAIIATPTPRVATPITIIAPKPSTHLNPPTASSSVSSNDIQVPNASLNSASPELSAETHPSTPRSYNVVRVYSSASAS